jgi:hypothetical protein
MSSAKQSLAPADRAPNLPLLLKEVRACTICAE